MDSIGPARRSLRNGTKAGIDWPVLCRLDCHLHPPPSVGRKRGMADWLRPP